MTDHRIDGHDRPVASEAAALPTTLAAATIALLTAIALAACSSGETDLTSAGSTDTADLSAQGEPDNVYASEAVELQRRDDGLTVAVSFPTPEPGTYRYPEADMIPPDAEPHPPIDQGDALTAEVFTLWMFVFNQPGLCTDGSCDADDLGEAAPAKGGVYQLDGRMATDDVVTFGGTVRIGQRPGTGAPLFNPIDAEVHVAVAAHGRVLSGPDLWRQLNGAVGNPKLWWAAAFSAS